MSSKKVKIIKNMFILLLFFLLPSCGTMKPDGLCFLSRKKVKKFDYNFGQEFDVSGTIDVLEHEPHSNPNSGYYNVGFYMAITHTCLVRGSLILPAGRSISLSKGDYINTTANFVGWREKTCGLDYCSFNLVFSKKEDVCVVKELVFLENNTSCNLKDLYSTPDIEDVY